MTMQSRPRRTHCYSIMLSRYLTASCLQELARKTPVTFKVCCLQVEVARFQPLPRVTLHCAHFWEQHAEGSTGYEKHVPSQSNIFVNQPQCPSNHEVSAASYGGGL